jgi:hypothetical protein
MLTFGTIHHLYLLYRHLSGKKIIRCMSPGKKVIFNDYVTWNAGNTLVVNQLIYNSDILYQILINYILTRHNAGSKIYLIRIGAVAFGIGAIDAKNHFFHSDNIGWIHRRTKSGTGLGDC